MPCMKTNPDEQWDYKHSFMGLRHSTECLWVKEVHSTQQIISDWWKCMKFSHIVIKTARGTYWMSQGSNTCVPCCSARARTHRLIEPHILNTLRARQESCTDGVCCVRSALTERWAYRGLTLTRSHVNVGFRTDSASPHTASRIVTHPPHAQSVGTLRHPGCHFFRKEILGKFNPSQETESVGQHPGCAPCSVCGGVMTHEPKKKPPVHMVLWHSAWSPVSADISHLFGTLCCVPGVSFQNAYMPFFLL